MKRSIAQLDPKELKFLSSVPEGEPLEKYRLDV